MITVAGAGGTTSDLGRAVVTSIQQYPDQLQAVVISRASLTVPEWLQQTGIEARKVNCCADDSLCAALQDFHTVG